jgi:parallel beta-helix repeat protein
VSRAIFTSPRHVLVLTILCLGLLLPGRPAAAQTAAIDIPDGTVYSTNITWSGDQVYRVHGALTVAGGATLTVQPGARIIFDAGGSLQVNDAALIADGTAGRPITFTASAPGITTWAGLRFADASVPASFDAAGAYPGGSLLRHVTLAWADTCVSIAGRAPYIVGSLFTDCTVAVDTGSSSARLAGNIFDHNQQAIVVSSGTQETLLEGNTFTDNLRCVNNNGMAVIAGNSFSGTRWGSMSGAIIGNTNSAWRARIYDNRFTGNTGGLSFGPVQQLDFRHNLIADNSGFWCDTAVGSGTICFSLRAGADPSTISDNTIIDNRSTGLRIGGAADRLTLANNNLFNNGQYDLLLSATGSVTLTMGATYWGGLTGDEIAARIYDCSDEPGGCGPDAATGRVATADLLAGPSQTAPGFIQAATTLPGASGTQPAAFDLTFSRPMQTAITPTLTFHTSHRGQLVAITHTIPAAGSLTAMVRDAAGQMWFGYACTAAAPACEPLRRFDGGRWHVYDPQNAGLPNAAAHGLFAQRTGDVWASFDAGWLGRYHDGTWRWSRPDATGDAVTAPVWTALGEDAEGRLWAGASDASDANAITLLRFDGASWQAMPLPALPGTPRAISHIVTDQAGRVWVRFGASVYIYANSGWTAYHPSAGGPAADQIVSLWSDSRGRVWAATATAAADGKSLYMLDGGAWLGWGSTDWAGCAGDGGVLHAGGFAEDMAGVIWANGTSPCGVFSYDGERWQAHPELPSAAQAQPLRLGIDGFQNLWLGGANGQSDLSVKWGGLDYLIAAGSWLSANRYRAPYSVDGGVPIGDYTLDVTAQDGDGMSATTDGVYTFTIAPPARDHHVYLPALRR